MRSLQSTRDLSSYLVALGKILRAKGAVPESMAVLAASRYAGGSPSEFPHQAQAVLEQVVCAASDALTPEQLVEAESVIAQLRDGFGRSGGA